MKKDKNRITIQKIIWIFLIGAFLGFLIESGYHILKHGSYMSKRGLLYGYIKPIYGVGAVIITVGLQPLKDKSKMEVFVFGSLLGGIFEYLCSLFLEIFFGTRMWNYDNMTFGINGRLFIPYLPVWGLIALFWLKLFLPIFNKCYNKINHKLMNVLSILLAVFLVYDIAISSLAVWRMKARLNGDKASNFYERYMDKHYSDEFIYKRVPYIKIVK